MTVGERCGVRSGGRDAHNQVVVVARRFGLACESDDNVCVIRRSVHCGSRMYHNSSFGSVGRASVS